jgi:hypothetical protein
MLSGHRTLSLSRMTSDQDEIVLVPSTGWPAIGASSGYREIDPRKALSMLETLAPHHTMEARRFASEFARNIYRLDDHEVFHIIRNAVSDGRILAVQKGAAKPAASGATADLRRLVADIEKASRGKLAFRGRHYRLVVDIDLAKLPRRDYYEVATQSEARAILNGMARESPPVAGLLAKASGRLTKDWRAPFSQPDGLVLLRRIQVQATAPRDDGPALTPSQMATLREPKLSFRPSLQVHGPVRLSATAKVEPPLRFDVGAQAEPAPTLDAAAV